MKILFLQNIGNTVGGVLNVNNSLAKRFANNKNEVYIVSVRSAGNIEFDNDNVKYKTIDRKKTWGCPLYSEIISLLKKGRIIDAINNLFIRIKYNIELNIDYKKLNKEIKEFKPDIIINSYYELLKAIPKEYLGKTINHYHCQFNQVLENSSQLKIFKKYKDKIKKFVWLTNATSNEAQKYELLNSTYIYNPIREFEKNYTKENTTQNRIIFLARYSKEKRLELAINIFNEIVCKKDFKDWKLDLYLVGNLDEKIKNKINDSKNIYFKGSVEKPEFILSKYYFMMMTSEFEGLPLTVLEAAKCGVPTIAFDFGESSKEVITEKTGILVKQDDIDEYKNKFIEILKNKDLRKKYSENCLKFSEQFLIDKIIEDWYKLFNER